MKTIDNKIEENKAQYDLDRQIAKTSSEIIIRFHQLYHQEMLVDMNL